MGVVAAIIPSTNPTSTAIYKALISIKARNACVMSPHPAAQRCILETWRVLHQAAAVARGAARGRALLHDRGHARGHAGADALPRHRRDPGHGRDRPGARGLFLGQAGLRRGARQRPRLHRAERGRAEGGARRDRRQDLRLRDALLVRAVARLRRGHPRPGDRGGQEERRLLPGRGGDRRPSRGWWSRRSGWPTPRSWASPRTFIAEKAGIKVPPETRVAGGAPGRRRARVPALDREALARARVLRGEGLARGLRARAAAPALRRHRPHAGHPQPRRRRDPRVRPQEAGVPHRRQHADLDGRHRLHHGPRALDEPRAAAPTPATSPPTTSRRCTSSTSSDWPTSCRGRPAARRGRLPRRGLTATGSPTFVAERGRGGAGPVGGGAPSRRRTPPSARAEASTKPAAVDFVCRGRRPPGPARGPDDQAPPGRDRDPGRPRPRRRQGRPGEER